jgi:hypothetical protein
MPSAGRTDHPASSEMDQLCGFFRACHSYTCIGASVTNAIPAAIAFRIKAVITPDWHSPLAKFLCPRHPLTGDAVCNNDPQASKCPTTTHEHRRDLRRWHHPRRNILFWLVGGLKVTGTTIRGTWQLPRSSAQQIQCSPRCAATPFV